jgi:hypothetical protein
MEPMPTPAPVHGPPSSRSRALRALWPALAVLALAVGFGDLARGGTALAPGLLVLGYFVLVPAAVIRTTGRRPRTGAARDAVPRRKSAPGT